MFKFISFCISRTTIKWKDKIIFEYRGWLYQQKEILEQEKERNN